MKHVFVETNFFIDVLRPFPKPEAEKLRDRHGHDVTLYVPWCSINEAKRTMERKVLEDLAFIDGAGKFFRRMQTQAQTFGTPPAGVKEIASFINAAREVRRDALDTFEAQVDGLAGQLKVIPPSQAVVTRTLTLFPIKSLQPFDEMVLGAVLTHAGDLFASGERELFFCNLNTKDFEPKDGNNLKNAYSGVGLTYIDSFRVP